MLNDFIKETEGEFDGKFPDSGMGMSSIQFNELKPFISSKLREFAGELAKKVEKLKPNHDTKSEHFASFECEACAEIYALDSVLNLLDQ